MQIITKNNLIMQKLKIIMKITLVLFITVGITSLKAQKSIEQDFLLNKKWQELFFDKSKIGKIKKGKYIICRVKGAPENKAPTILEIIKAEGNELILKNMVQEDYLRYRVKE